MKNTNIVCGEICHIMIRPEKNGKDIVWAKISTTDMDIAGRFKWFLRENHRIKYATASFKDKGKTVNFYLHRLLLKFPKGMVVDHKNGDGLDNTKDNLRPVTRSENSLNRKNRYLGKFIGVNWCKTKNKWRARIKHNKKTAYDKTFDNKKDAVLSRANAFVELYGPETNPDQTRLSKTL